MWICRLAGKGGIMGQAKQRGTYEERLKSTFLKENTEFYKSKIRKEMENAIKKDRILNESDAKLYCDKIRWSPLSLNEIDK